MAHELGYNFTVFIVKTKPSKGPSKALMWLGVWYNCGKFLGISLTLFVRGPAAVGRTHD